MKFTNKFNKLIKLSLFIIFTYIISVYMDNVFTYEKNLDRWFVVFVLIGGGYAIGMHSTKKSTRNRIFKELEGRGLVFKDEEDNYFYTEKFQNKKVLSNIYIKDYHFSPFEIKDNIVYIYNREFEIRDKKIYQKGKEVTEEVFYDKFIELGKDRWFTKDFIQSFENKQSAIPSSIKEFVIYCDYKVSFMKIKDNISS